jgi:hypothetical protein
MPPGPPARPRLPVSLVFETIAGHADATFLPCSPSQLPPLLPRPSLTPRGLPRAWLPVSLACRALKRWDVTKRIADESPGRIPCFQPHPSRPPTPPGPLAPRHPVRYLFHKLVERRGRFADRVTGTDRDLPLCPSASCRCCRHLEGGVGGIGLEQPSPHWRICYLLVSSLDFAAFPSTVIFPC